MTSRRSCVAPEAAVADNERAFSGRFESLAQHAPDETGAVELIGKKPPVLPQQNCVGRASDVCNRSEFINQLQVVTLCGIVTSAPRIFVSVKTDRGKTG